LATNTLPLDLGRPASDRDGDSRLALEHFLQQQDAESPLTQYLQVLIRQRWIVLAIIAAGVLAAVFINATTVKLYRSTGSIEIAREAARVVNDGDTQPKTNVAGLEFYQTQYGLLRSRALAEQTVASLRLAVNANFLYGYGGRKPPANALGGDRQQRELTAARLVMSHLTIEPIRGSSLVQVSFDSPDPGLSAAVVNAIAKNFIASNLNRRFQATAYARQFLQQQIETTRQKLEASERALVAYAGQQRIINFEAATGGKDNDQSNGVSVESTDLRALNDALNAAKIDRAQAETRYQQASRSGGLNAPESLQDSTINALRGQRAQLQSDYQRLSAQFRSDYPQMVALRQQIAELDKQLSKQGSVVLDSLRAAYQAAAQRQSELQAQVDSLKNSVINLRGRSVQYNTLQRDADTNRELYNALLQRYKEIGVAGGVENNNVAIVDPARLPDRPSSPKLLVNLLLAMLGGGLVAALVAAGLEQIDEGLVDPADLEEKLGLPLLGVAPKMQLEDPLNALRDPRSKLVEAYLAVQANLELSTAQGAPRSLAVISTRPREGKSTTTVALAQSLARARRKVVLVDADLRSPSIHAAFGLKNGVGVSNFLSGAEDLDGALHPTEHEGLTVMTAGPQPPNAGDLLMGDRLALLVKRLKERFDHVIVDSPPVIGLADAPLVAAAVDGVIYAVEARATPAGAVRTALSRLRTSQAHVLGAVLTKFEARKGGQGFDYGYGFDYDYGR